MNNMEIKPYHKNAKKHPNEQIARIARSIQEFGFNQPIVVNPEGVIIVGHGRYEAAKMLEIPDKDIPTLVVSLSEEKEKAYRLADNKLNESDWDMALVVEELKELSEDMIELTGFDNDLLIEPDEKDDIIPENPPTRAKIGDLWALGEHRVVCGDATDSKTVGMLMDGKKADMVFTDPPYNIAYKGQGRNTSNEILNDDVTEGAFDAFLFRVFANYKDHSKVSAGNYVFHASRTQTQFEKAMSANNYEIKNQLIWNKPMSALGWGDYRWKHEPFFYAGQKGKGIQFYGDRTHSTVWDFQKSEQQLLNWAKRQKKLEAEGKTTIWSMKRDNVQEYVHPTQKPVELITYAITNSTKNDDLVIDFFLGSGSTLIAAEKTGRICYGMDLDPKYVDIIIKRWEDYTGQVALKLTP